MRKAIIGLACLFLLTGCQQYDKSLPAEISGIENDMENVDSLELSRLTDVLSYMKEKGEEIDILVNKRTKISDKIFEYYEQINILKASAWENIELINRNLGAYEKILTLQKEWNLISQEIRDKKIIIGEIMVKTNNPTLLEKYKERVELYVKTVNDYNKLDIEIKETNIEIHKFVKENQDFVIKDEMVMFVDKEKQDIYTNLINKIQEAMLSMQQSMEEMKSISESMEKEFGLAL